MRKTKRVKGRVKSWLVNRYPAQRSVKLTQNRIFILPTMAGMAYLVVVLLILLLAVNYQNNLAYAVCFTLLSLFVTAILHTYANLSGLKISALSTEPAFSNEIAYFRYQLHSARAMNQLTLGFNNNAQITIDLKKNVEHNIEVPYLCSRRGWQRAELFRIGSLYPLGLFRAWSWLRFDQTVLVYPKPIEGGQLDSFVGRDSRDNMALAKGDEEFEALSPYYPGAAKNSIAWKAYAKGYGLQVKTYQGSASDELWLDWSLWPELSEEQRLSCMCYWSIQLSQNQTHYGLRLPGVTFEPSAGEKHNIKVLEQLALYGIEGC
ncbi:DUF58 domain-containing protein [Neptunomonas japonica]|uniref:DUF58 domain-containing protein n=1 Tax=Neptunomonas japonica TaxID=417574 RepID=UPI00049032FA|nr:DUF58 domain-containing protein [Neptunomonas japonica]